MENLKLHIEKEKEMLDAVNVIIDEIDDERVKKILMMIYDDELTYHPFMVTFLDVVLKRELILEQDIWDMLFKNLPTNGHIADPYVGKDYNPYFSGFLVKYKFLAFSTKVAVLFPYNLL